MNGRRKRAHLLERPSFLALSSRDSSAFLSNAPYSFIRHASFSRSIRSIVRPMMKMMRLGERVESQSGIADVSEGRCIARSRIE